MSTQIGQNMMLVNSTFRNAKSVKEERRLVDTFSEFYLTDKADIETFIHMFAVNADAFDYDSYLNVDVNETKVSKLIVPG